MIQRSSILLTVTALSVAATDAGQAQSVLTRHVRETVVTGEARSAGRLPANQTMSLDLVLPLRDPAGLKRFLNEVYDPGSLSYRKFLSVAEFTERFGPTVKDYDAVVRFAITNGFSVVGGSRDGMLVQVKGPVSAVEAAFHVNMWWFQHPTESRVFFAPDQEPTVDLPFKLWHISGLDNYSIPHPMVVKKTDYAKAHGVSPESVVSHAITGSGPSGSFLGSDMRAAYYGNGPLTGAGQNLGLWEFWGTNLDDLTTYFSTANQTDSVPITLVSVDGGNTTCSWNWCDDTEPTLDMTQAIGMAPGLASLTMYVGVYDTTISSALTTHNPLPNTIACSWGWTPADPSTLDPYFQRMAAQGQSFFVASGDSSTWSSTDSAWPADDPYVISVGGTDLVTAGAAGPWQSETAWVDSGGGFSPDNIAIPSWQKLSGVINWSNKGSTSYRNGPDVSANANFSFYVCAKQTTCTANLYGGTSFAAPMWAAYIALVNQQLQSNNEPPIGFLNPTIYSQNVKSTSYAANFHDITSGISGSYSAVKGYDLVTGWGSPAAGLVNALVASQLPSFSISASPGTMTVMQGGTGSSVITATMGGGLNSPITLTANGQPAGVTVSFSPASIITGAASSAMSVTVAPTVPAGTYPITVAGASGGAIELTTVYLTVSTQGFTIGTSPAALNLQTGTQNAVTITSTVAGGLQLPIVLTAWGGGSGVSVSFSPALITGAASSTVTITASGSAPAGNRIVTIQGCGGGTCQRTSLLINVNN